MLKLVLGEVGTVISQYFVELQGFRVLYVGKSAKTSTVLTS